MKNIKIIEESIIRVRFRDSLDSKKYGRPTNIRKIKALVTYVKKKDNLSYDKDVEEILYTHRLKRSPGTEFIDPDTFITEWKKGHTPTPKPLYKYNDEALVKRGFTTEQINDIRKRNWRAKDVKILASKLKVKYKQAKELLTKHGSLSKVLELVDKEEIKGRANKKTSRPPKKTNKQRIKTYSLKNGTIVINYVDENGVSKIKSFPGKGLFENNEYKTLMQKEQKEYIKITNIRFMYKYGEKEAMRAKLREAMHNQLLEKNKVRREKRKKEIEEKKLAEKAKK